MKSDYAINASGDVANDQFYPAGGPPDLPTGLSPTYSWPDTSTFTGICAIHGVLSPASILDGTSNTYLIGEKYLDPDYYYNGQDGADNETAMSGYDNDNGRCTFAYTVNGTSTWVTPYQDTPGNAGPDGSSSGIDGGVDDWGSAHTTGCRFVFCDGSVHVINFSIDPETHRRLANRADGLPIDGSKF